MALVYSQGAVTKMLGADGLMVVHAETLALGDGAGAGGADTVTDSGSGFVTAGFKVGQKIWIRGATNASNDVSAIVLTDVAAGTLTFAAGTLVASQSAGTAFTVIGCNGGGFANMFTGGKMALYTAGSAVPDVNASSSSNGATKIIEWTPIVIGVTVTYDGTNNYGTINLTASVVATSTSAGTATWGRFAGAGEDIDSASTTAVRCQFTAGETTGEMRLNESTFTMSESRPLGSCIMKAYEEV